MTELDLFLVRHAESLWNAQGRLQGQSNPPLSPLGVWQAECLGMRLRQQTFTKVLVSPLQRAIITAELALPEVKYQLEPRLIEIARGPIEGTSDTSRTPEQRALLHIMTQDPHAKPAGGESIHDLQTRVQQWLHQLPPTGCYGVISHGAVIEQILLVLLQTETRLSFELNNTGVSHVRLAKAGRAGVRVMGLNDVGHLYVP